MKKILLLAIVVILLNFISGIEKYNSVKDALKDYPAHDRRHGKQPKFVYFKINKEKKSEIDYFSKILYRFMNTMGVRPYFVNLKDDILLGIVPVESQIDTAAILDTFKGVVDSVEVKDKME